MTKQDFRKLRDDSTNTENLLRTENQILRKQEKVFTDSFAEKSRKLQKKT